MGVAEPEPPPPEPSAPTDGEPLNRPPLTRPRWQRAALLAAGFLSLGLGILGIVLPLLPTTPLVLLAAFFFAHGSERTHGWLLRHQLFGPIVREWQNHRRIPARAKWTSIVLVVVAFTISAFVVPPSVYTYGALGLGGAALVVFLARLPTTPEA